MMAISEPGIPLALGQKLTDPLNGCLLLWVMWIFRVQPVSGFEGEQAAAIVFISDPAQQQTISPEILSILYGLTRAEARLAQELAMGKTLDEISDIYHVSKHTLRTQLKSIFSKTGLKRQSDLVRLILGGPATLNLGK